MAVHSVNYVDENGDSHSGIRAARQLRDVKNDWAGNMLSKVLGVLPDQLLQMNMAVKYLNLYQIGDKVVGAIPVLLFVYSILYILMCPLLYQVYRRTQLK